MSKTPRTDALRHRDHGLLSATMLIAEMLERIAIALEADGE